MEIIPSKDCVKPNELKVGDWVVYQPYPECPPNAMSNPGIVKEVIDSHTSVVTFGHNSIYGTRTGRYGISNLYKYTKQ